VPEDLPQKVSIAHEFLVKITTHVMCMRKDVRLGEYAIPRDVNANALHRMEEVLARSCENCSALLNVLKYEAKKANDEKKKSMREQDQYETEMLSMIKIVDLEGQSVPTGGGGNGRRDGNESNNNSLNLLQSLSNSLTGNIDFKQAGLKKTVRQMAKRFFRP
jgi:hypothetical protein